MKSKLSMHSVWADSWDACSTTVWEPKKAGLVGDKVANILTFGVGDVVYPVIFSISETIR